MGLERLLLASIVAMWISPCVLLPLASSEEIFPEAEGPAAESSDELWLRSGPPPRVVDDNDYGARANGCDDTEVKLRAALLASSLNRSSLCDLLAAPAARKLVVPAVLIGAASVSGVSCGVEGGLQLLRLPVRVPRARGEDLPPDARELLWPLQSYLNHCNGELATTIPMHELFSIICVVMSIDSLRMIR